MQRRQILPKEDDRRWPRRDQTQRSCYRHKPVTAVSNHVVPFGPLYPMWGTPHPASIQTWGSQGYYPWQPTETWHWKPYPGVQPDAWGCPVMPIPQGNYSTFTQISSLNEFWNNRQLELIERKTKNLGSDKVDDRG